jgi:hypothetical protein
MTGEFDIDKWLLEFEIEDDAHDYHESIYYTPYKDEFEI